MPVRTLTAAAALLALAVAIGAASAHAPKTAKPAAAPSACSKAALAPYVGALRSGAASFVSDLSEAGGSSGTISSITITLGNGQLLRLGFSHGTLRLSGDGVPAACKPIVAKDDWEGAS